MNKQVAVEITKTHPQYGDVEERLTLSKWWFGGRTSFHIPNPGQWLKIADIIENELGPLLGWQGSQELANGIRGKLKSRKQASAEFTDLFSAYPDTLQQVIRAIDLDKLTKQGVEDLVSLIDELSSLMAGLDQGFKTAFLSIVKELPKQRKRALENLGELLKRWSLHQITTVTQHVRQRLDLIELFKERVLDPRTYELRDDNSIHRILERAMWLIDERYWLMQSNATARTLIGQAMAENDKKRYGKLRPDFVCGTVGERLIIIEIKRPAHTLTIDDLNQLETYVSLAEKYLTYSIFEAYLIGNKRDDDLMNRLKLRSNRFKVWTYSDLIGASEERYRSYLGLERGASVAVH